MQKLVDGFVLHHVVDEHEFKASKLFYRFYEDETGKSVISLAESTTKAGWLSLKGTWGTNEHYALISSNEGVLFIFASDISSAPVATVALNDCKISLTNGPLGLELCSETEKAVAISFPSPEEKEQWMKALVSSVFISQIRRNPFMLRAY